MKKEEVADEMAKKLLALFMDSEQARGSAFFQFPEDDPGAVECGFQTEFGRVAMRFYPVEGFGAWAREQGEALNKALLDGTTFVSESGRVGLRDAESAEQLAAEGGQRLALWVMCSYFESLSMTLGQALKSTTQDAVALTTQKLLKGMKREAVKNVEGLVSVTVGGVDEEWERANSLAAEGRARIQGEVRKALSVEPELDRMGPLYAELKPIWRDVQRIFRKYRDRDWQGIVRATYKDTVIGNEPLNFDSDLLARVTGDINGLSEREQELIETKCGTDSPFTPSTIAVEHAARLCGASRHQFSTRRLFEAAAKGTATEEVRRGKFSKPE